MLDAVRSVAERFVGRFRVLGQAPDEIALESAVSLSAEAGLVIASTATAANFSVRLTWNRSDQSGPTGNNARHVDPLKSLGLWRSGGHVTGAEQQKPDEALVSSVVRIKGGDREPIGAGFLVAPDAVLTCAHVVAFALGLTDAKQVADGASVTLDMPLDPRLAGQIWTAQVGRCVAEADDGTGDVALLRLRTAIPGARPLPMVEPRTAWDDEVGVVGFTSTATGGIWVKAKLSGPTGEGRRQFSRMDDQTAYVEKGFSGSPVWDPRHRAVVGIVSVAQSGRQAQQAFAIRKDSVVRDIPELDSVLSPASPFLGLETFQESHAHVFFGRQDDVQKVAGALADQSSVTVYGPSGSGKSSLALAGVVPQMRADKYDVLVVNAGEADSPLVALANEMYEVFVIGRPHEPVRARSAGEVQTWLTDLGLVDTLHRVRGKTGGKLLVVLDQAEALLARDDAKVAQVVSLLFPETRAATGPRVLLTLRADFMDQALKHPHLGPALRSSVTLPLTPMSREQLRDVITKPLDQVPGVTYEQGLVDRILNDAGNEPGTLPLLGFVLQKLWQEKEHGQLRLATYEAAGGVSGALANHAERAWLRCLGKHSASEDGQEAGEGEHTGQDKEAAQCTEAEARQLLTGLVRVLPGSPAPLRRRLTRQEAGDRWQIAQWFAGPEWRLLVMRGGHGEPETVELAHEALVTVWPALQDQVRADSEFLAGRAELAHERDRWTKGHKASGLLPGALQLAAIERRLVNRENELEEEEQNFLDIARQRRQARRNRARAAWIAVAVVFALIAALGTFLIYQSRVSTQREAESRSRLLANYSAEVAKQDPGQAALIAMGAYQVAPTDEARNALLRRYDQFKDVAWVLSGTEGLIRYAETSVDGAVTLVASSNGRATLFVRQSRGSIQRLQLSLDQTVFQPLVSRDGRRIAYVSAAGTFVWRDVDVTADKPEGLLGAAHTLRAPEFKEMADREAGRLTNERLTASFSPDAEELAVASGGRLRLWDLATGRHRDVPGRVPTDDVSVWFGHDKNTLVVLQHGSGINGGSLTTVEVGTGKVRALAHEVDTGAPYGAAVGMSGDGTVVVVCRQEQQGGDTVIYQALRVTDGRVLKTYTYPGLTSDCGGIPVDEKGERFAANSYDTWSIVGTRQGIPAQHATNLPTPEKILSRLLGNQGQPLVLTLTEDKTALTTLSLTPNVFVGRDIVVNAPQLIDDGQTLVARIKPSDPPDSDEALALIDAASGRIRSEVKRPDSPDSSPAANSLAVNEAGTLVADVTGNNKILIRRIPSLRQVAQVTTLAPPVDKSGNAEPLTLTFLPGGDELLTLSGSRIEHWNARTGRRLSKTIDARTLKLSKKNPPLFGSTEEATDSGFAIHSRPEKGYVQIMIHGDPVLHAVNLRTGKENKALRVRLGSDVEEAELDSSGQYAAAQTPGGMLELWSAETGQQPTKVVGPLGPVGSDYSFTGTGFTLGFTGNDTEFYLASGGSVRFQQLSDPSLVKTYDFATDQYFVAATKDGKTLLRTLSMSNLDGNGRLDLIRLDPQLWEQHLCEAVGRNLTQDERSGVPAELPDRICAA